MPSSSPTAMLENPGDHLEKFYNTLIFGMFLKFSKLQNMKFIKEISWMLRIMRFCIRDSQPSRVGWRRGSLENFMIIYRRKGLKTGWKTLSYLKSSFGVSWKKPVNHARTNAGVGKDIAEFLPPTSEGQSGFPFSHLSMRILGWSLKKPLEIRGNVPISHLQLVLEDPFLFLLLFYTSTVL